MAQWVRQLDYLTTHTNLSPIRRGFTPGFVNYKKWCTRLLQPQVIKFTSYLIMIGSSLGVLRLLPLLILVAEILLKVALITNQIKSTSTWEGSNSMTTGVTTMLTRGNWNIALHWSISQLQSHLYIKQPCHDHSRNCSSNIPATDRGFTQSSIRWSVHLFKRQNSND